MEVNVLLLETTSIGPCRQCPNPRDSLASDRTGSAHAIRQITTSIEKLEISLGRWEADKIVNIELSSPRFDDQPQVSVIPVSISTDPTSHSRTEYGQSQLAHCTQSSLTSAGRTDSVIAR